MVLVDVVARAQLFFLELELLLHAVEDRDPARVQRPVEVPRLRGSARRSGGLGQRRVSGQVREEALEHGADGREGMLRHLPRQCGFPAHGGRDELELAGRAGDRAGLPVHELVDAAVGDAGAGELVAEDKGRRRVGEEDGRDLGVFRARGDDVLEVGPHVDAADLAGEAEDPSWAAAQGV